MREFHILNLGAGVQSTTLYLLSMRGEEGIPRFDACVFADTQEEPREVYDHLVWLESLGGPPIIRATAGKLGDDIIHGKGPTGYSKITTKGRRFASIPCFTMAPGETKEGRTRRQCTKEYKIEVVERAIRRQVVGLAPYKRIPKDVRITQYFGLSFDEPKRVSSVRTAFLSKNWCNCAFPLFEIEWERSDCRSWLKERYPDRYVPRSACVFCPYHNNEEWRRIRDTEPDSWARAIEIDEAIRKESPVCTRQLDKKLYLHRSCVPLALAVIDDPESAIDLYNSGFTQECEGMCGL